MDNNLKMNILITGVTGGLGQAFKKCFESNGFKVYGHTANQTADIQIDFNDIKSVKKLESFIQNNDISCLINNAGIYSDVNLSQLEDEEIQKILNINLVSPIIITKYLYRYLESINKEGLVININSLAGKYPNYNESIYCASKFGLSGFGSSISINQKDSKIKVIDCFFGGLKTNMTKNRSNFEKLIDPNEAAEMILNILKGKTGLINSFEYRRTL